jgi:hypothetical protein
MADRIASRFAIFIFENPPSFLVAVRGQNGA